MLNDKRMKACIASRHDNGAYSRIQLGRLKMREWKMQE